MESINGRVAVVTGAASGIGFAVAYTLAADGARLLLADIDATAVDTAAAQIRATGAEVDSIELDVRDPEAVEKAGFRAMDRFGGLHVAVNNAGIVNGGTSWELPLEAWHEVLDVNLWGVIHCIRGFVPRILETGTDGHVVNIGSMASVTALAGLGPYTVAKHGVLGLSDVLRARVGGIGQARGRQRRFPRPHPLRNEPHRHGGAVDRRAECDGCRPAGPSVCVYRRSLDERGPRTPPSDHRRPG